MTVRQRRFVQPPIQMSQTNSDRNHVGHLKAVLSTCALTTAEQAAIQAGIEALQATAPVPAQRLIDKEFQTRVARRLGPALRGVVAVVLKVAAEVSKLDPDAPDPMAPGVINRGLK